MSDPWRPGTDPLGPPQPPDLLSPDPSRRGRIPWYGWVVLVGVLVFASFAASRWLGLGPTVLDRDQVEADVAAQFQERFDVAVEVDCGRRMEVLTGRDYECDAVTADHEELTLLVTITDEDPPAYEWDVA